jgi:uncharacterized protein (UPF0248 family)
MQTLEALLHRIQWDAEFGKGAFALGYYDRIAHEERVVALESVTMDARQPKSFLLHDDGGLVAHVPLHRVRTVYKNGVIIWQRPERK